MNYSNASNIDKVEKKKILVPSKCTVYISNLPFSLTNSDIFKIFLKYGKLIKVTIMRNKATRKSKGVAFLLYDDRVSAELCVKQTDGCKMFDRTLKSNIAKDNGRAADFIKRREYPDKTRCYECGESGHLSYVCPKNILGEREPLPKKKRTKIHGTTANKTLKAVNKEIISEEEEDFDEESLSAAIRYQQELREGEEFLQAQFTTKSSGKFTENDLSVKRKKMKKSSYFSDEEEVSD